MATDTDITIESDAQVSADSQPTGPHSANLPRTIIRPASGWQLVNVRELWQYRELLYFLTWRDVKVRYKQTVLGAAWAILQPAMMMVVFSIFFGRMADVNTGGLPYPLFVFCGLLPWTFFATAIANAGNSVVGSERLITKIYFPRLAIPFASVGAALVDFAVAFSMLIVLMLWYRVTPTLNLLFVPVLVILFTLAALGVGTLLAALNVAYRDFRYVIPFLVQLWMFATPTVYMQPVEGTGHRAQGTDSVGNALRGVPPTASVGNALRGVPPGESSQEPGVRSQETGAENTGSLSLRERAGVRAADGTGHGAQGTDSEGNGLRAVTPAEGSQEPGIWSQETGTGNNDSLSHRERAGVRAVEGTGNRAQGTDSVGNGLRAVPPTNNEQRTTDNGRSEGAVPDNIQALLNLNPLTGLVAAFRAAVVGRPLPWSMLGWSTLGVTLSFVIGCLYFRKVEDSFADII